MIVCAQTAWADGKADLGNDTTISSTSASGLVSSAADKVGARLGLSSFDKGICGPLPCDSAYDAGFWAETGYDYFYKTGAGRMKGGLFRATAGLDRRVGDELVVGVALSEHRLDIDLSGRRSLEQLGLTIMPYLGYQLSEDSLVDVSLGYSWFDNDMTARRFHNVQVDDEYNSRRLFTGAGYSKFWNYDQWAFSGRLGALYLHQNNSDIELFRKQSGRSWNLLRSEVSGRAVYNDGIFRPFGGLTWSQDLIKSGPSDDMTGFDFDLGFDWDFTSCASLELTGTYGLREDLNRYGARLALKVGF